MDLPDDPIQKTLSLPYCDITTKKFKYKTSKFFKNKTKTLSTILEGLQSFLAQSATGLWKSRDTI